MAVRAKMVAINWGCPGCRRTLTGEGNGVCPLLCKCTSANMLNANGLFCVFPPLSRWLTAEACPRLTRCVCPCDINREKAMRDTVSFVQQAAQDWIINAEGQEDSWIALVYS